MTAPDGINETDVRRILSTLAADSMEGRLTGTRGANKAAAFIDREMRSIGLSPAGDSGFYQKVALSAGTTRGVPRTTTISESANPSMAIRSTTAPMTTHPA